MLGRLEEVAGVFSGTHDGQWEAKLDQDQQP